jgi:hypothetical protein
VAPVCNVNDVLDDQVSLDLQCLDRIYLKAYVPNLQPGGQVVTFLSSIAETRSRHLRCSPRSATTFRGGEAFSQATTSSR